MESKKNKLIEYVSNYVPFYIDFFSPMERKKNASEYWNEIPIVNKQIIKDNIISFISKEINVTGIEMAIDTNKDYKKEYMYVLGGRKVIGEYTSGTSGCPFLSLKTEAERVRLGRNLWKIRNSFSDVNPKDFFNFVHNYGEKTYPFPFDFIEDENTRIKKELEYLYSNPYKWWHINLAKLGRYKETLEKNHMSIPRVEVIENTGAYMSEEEVKKYSSFFKCKIANNYGCREVWTIAYSDMNGNLRVNELSVLVELIDLDNRVITEDDIEGRVVVTSLEQYIMPFIRYDTGDKAFYSDGQLVLVPNRALIAGTNLYGTPLFKDVILELPLVHNICNFSDISIVQIGELEFKVNIRGYDGDRKKIEEAFIKGSEYVFKHNNYKYIFSYNNLEQSKSIFTVALDK